MLRKWDFSISKEHNMALDILFWIEENDYTITDLRFELLNRDERKSGYTYVINKYPINIQSIERHLYNFGINIQFIDKTTTEKKYITVFKERPE